MDTDIGWATSTLLDAHQCQLSNEHLSTAMLEKHQACSYRHQDPTVCFCGMRQMLQPWAHIVFACNPLLTFCCMLTQ